MMTQRKPRTAKYLQKIQGFGTDASFVANLILNWHQAPATKLRNLASLLEAGYHFRTGQFSTDTLLANGCAVPWSALDTLDGVLDVVNPRY